MKFSKKRLDKKQVSYNFVNNICLYFSVVSKKIAPPKKVGSTFVSKNKQIRRVSGFTFRKIGCLNHDFWLALPKRRVRQVQRAALDAMAQKLRFGRRHGVTWIPKMAQKKHAFGLRRGNVLFKKISLQKVWRHTPNCRCHVDSLPRFLTPEGTPRQAASPWICLWLRIPGPYDPSWKARRASSTCFVRFI